MVRLADLAYRWFEFYHIILKESRKIKEEEEEEEVREKYRNWERQKDSEKNKIIEKKKKTGIPVFRIEEWCLASGVWCSSPGLSEDSMDFNN